jgi:hypothetical protein
VSLPVENNEMHIFISSQHYWDCSPNNMLAEIKISVLGFLKTRNRGTECTVIGISSHVSNLVEMAPTPKRPLT